MSTATSIEWTEATWNPTTGCDRISPGCDRCYAMTMARRLKAMGSAKYQNDGDPRTSGPGFAVTMHQESVLDPIVKWPRKSQMVFLDSMSDVFHARVVADFQGKIFATMALTPQHSYQVFRRDSLCCTRSCCIDVRAVMRHERRVGGHRCNRSNARVPMTWIPSGGEMVDQLSAAAITRIAYPDLQIQSDVRQQTSDQEAAHLTRIPSETTTEKREFDV
ncbi:DUF5131 family protein [Mycobacterium avium]|uniref:DUF5131 family protein n=1 Tax=Mycobacterium avium TaxID=1764 RepID=UPI001CDA6130|nr:DUF5131 family protein [Mycobacterium avium]MCA2338413.1 DUF5131 family protein [Mycobacterium avium]